LAKLRGLANELVENLYIRPLEIRAPAEADALQYQTQRKFRRPSF
jgi:hypothetical protein